MPSITYTPPPREAKESSLFDGVSVSDTSPVVSPSFYIIAGRGLVLYLFTEDKNGSFKIEVRLTDTGEWRELATQAVSAGQLVVIDFDFFVPDVRVTFTASSSGGTTIHTKVYTYPI